MARKLSPYAQRLSRFLPPPQTREDVDPYEDLSLLYRSYHGHVFRLPTLSELEGDVHDGQ